MADIGKRGYQYTGYTEPFITPIEVTSGLKLDAVDYSGFGAGVVAIGNTEYRNAGLFLRVATGVTAGTSFTASDVNFDYRMDAGFVGLGKWVISDGSATAVVSKVSYNNVTQLYTITVGSNLTVVAGQGCPVVGRRPDVGAAAVIAASKTYAAGEKVQEVYAPELTH
jgi:hypothetical protein